MFDDPTLVDREIAALQQANEIRLVKLFAKEGHDMCIIQTKDYIESIKAILPDGYITVDESVVLQQSNPTLTRPSSLPVASSASSAASSGSIILSPIKSQSTAIPRFAPWPSSSKSSASLSSATSATTTQSHTSSSSSSSSSSSLPPQDAMVVPTSTALATAAPSSSLKQRISLKRRTTPQLSSEQPRIDSNADLTAPAPSSDATDQISKKRKLPPSPASTSSIPIPSSSSISSVPFLANTATGGVNPKLHIPFNDLAFDERFPSMNQMPNTAKFSSHDAAILLTLFIQHLLPVHTDISITQEKLLDAVYHPFVHRFHSMSSEQAVSCLLHSGLLLFKTSSSFFLSAPSLPRLMAAIRSGRKEIVTILKRRQFHELTLNELMQKRTLKSTPCRIEFHLREMLGTSDIIELIQTAVGPMVRVVKKQ